MTTTEHWNTSTRRYIEPVLAKGKKLTRIATGFFTVEGYDLIREHLINKRTYLMVGFDETSHDRARQKLIDEIMLYLSTWVNGDRRGAVLALVDQLEKKRFFLGEQALRGFVDTRLRKRDHAKVFIVDDKEAMVGSGNLTASGLRGNYEAMTLVTDEQKVAFWVKRFKEFWEAPNTIDLTQELLDTLLRWLALSSPYDVYLKTIEALIGDDDTLPPRPEYKVPVQYQMVVVERVLRQLKEWGGAMVVASTGLGKTVIATHIALRLRQSNDIYNVIVFAPKQVHPNWEMEMENAGLSCRVITRDLLDQPAKRKAGKVYEMETALARADSKYIIFVDESHHFMNKERAKDGEKRHSFKRLSAAIGRGAKIVLLTATPYSKGINDLNNQLYLLPHQAPASYKLADGRIALTGIIDEQVEPNAWKVVKEVGFFDEFIDLPVCTVISTSQVAKDFAEHAADGDFVMFGQARRWIPRVEIKKIKVPVPLEAEVSHAIRDKYFRHKVKRFMSRGQWQRSETTIEAQAETAWTSSPLALREVVNKTLDGTYNEKWMRPLDEQTEVLLDIQRKLNRMDYQDDEKFWTLRKYVSEAKEAGRKVVIFTERHATAVYLERGLNEQFPALHVAATSIYHSGEYKQKHFEKEVMPLLTAFAPEANKENIDLAEGHPSYDVFIATDAYSNGVNMQDAEIVISYDLAWTPDTIIQRAGRVLRFWKSPRTVSLYIFVGDFTTDTEGSRITNGVEKRLYKLAERSQQAQQFSELPVFPKSEGESYDSLGDLSRVKIADLGVVDITAIEEFTGVSGYLRHITELKQNQEYASLIPDDISSAMAYDGGRHLIYLLLRHERVYYWSLYDVYKKTLESVQEDALLSLIQCAKETPVAEVDPALIEHHAQSCHTKWLESRSDIDHSKVERICSLYLIPYKDQTPMQGGLFAAHTDS